MPELTVKDHAEAVAIYRSEIVGALTRRHFSRGQLRAEILRLCAQSYRPPGMERTVQHSFATLERWYYAYKRGGLPALHPGPRSDRGRARELSEAQRQLLLDVRREHPSASASLILRTLVLDGRIDPGAVSEPTVRRLFREHGLDRVPMRDGAGGKTRLRWQAERPGALWHGDVCHGAPLVIEAERRPVRIHALLDDAARYVIAIEAMHTEREVDMLGLMVRAVRKHGVPDALYLDNGSTYRGDLLRIACARLGTTLMHARPYDPEARGKMERFWRTLRQGCLDFVGALGSLHDLNVRLWAWVDEHYHPGAHAGLMGQSPARVYAATPRPADAIDEAKLREALTTRVRRRVRRDTTVSVEGRDWEMDQGHLAGRLVTVAHCLIAPEEPPWVEHDGKRLALHPVDPARNARRKRPPRRTQVEPRLRTPVDFDPAGALLDRAAHRTPKGGAR